MTWNVVPMSGIIDAHREIRKYNPLSFKETLILMADAFGFHQTGDKSKEDLTGWYQFRDWYQQCPSNVPLDAVRGPYSLVILKAIAAKYRASTQR
jgi:hypothetical protein